MLSTKRSATRFGALLALGLLATSAASSWGAGDTIGAAAPGPRCEWSPRRVYLPAQLQCGSNDLALPNMGAFDCGRVAAADTCVEQCFFIDCYQP